jgi:hypothetical protein
VASGIKEVEARRCCASWVRDTWNSSKISRKLLDFKDLEIFENSEFLEFHGIPWNDQFPEFGILKNFKTFQIF